MTKPFGEEKRRSTKKIVCPYVGVVLKKALALSVGIKASVSFIVSITATMEVSMMISTICAMCVVAGTALLGRSGDLFPTLREGERRTQEDAVEVWE